MPFFSIGISGLTIPARIIESPASKKGLVVRQTNKIMAIASIPESFSLIKVLGRFEHKVNAVGLKNLGNQGSWDRLNCEDSLSK